ncbi:MAG: hypothetical protein JWL72_2727 [Ilumatobacteraceae bacterium]|nr:hypothetical protein [Ilumatobacteraceae bacterium]
MATVINDTQHVEVEASIADDRWLMTPGAFEALTGWTLKPEGMCREDVCAPIYRKQAVLSPDGMVDLVEAAPVIGMTAVADIAREVAALGASASARAESMTTLQAPAFTLPDMAGKPVSLHDFDRRKVLLLALSSW